MNIASSSLLARRPSAGARPPAACPASIRARYSGTDADIVPPLVPDCRVGTAAEPHPRPVGPVLEIVPRRAGRAARGSRSRTARSRPPRGAAIVSRYMSAASSSDTRDQPLPRHLGGQRRLRVDLEQVDRRVLGREVGERVHRHAEVGERLPRQPQHQVEADVVEAGPARRRRTPGARAPGRGSGRGARVPRRGTTARRGSAG